MRRWRPYAADVVRLLDEIYTTYRDELLGALAASGIWIAGYESLTNQQRAQLESYFLDRVFPVLTPLAFDPGRPFPHISNLSLNLAVVIRDAKGSEHFARVKVPDSIPQLVPIPKDSGTAAASEGLVWLEQVIVANLQSLFPGLEIVAAHPFHVTRDAEIAIKELEADDLLETIEEAVRQRRFGNVVRLMVTDDMPAPHSRYPHEQSGNRPERCLSCRWAARS